MCMRWPHPALLQHLEHSLDALHLSSFGLMDTTLEEVFLKVSEEDQSLENSEAGERPRCHWSACPPPVDLHAGLGGPSRVGIVATGPGSVCGRGGPRGGWP